MRIISWHKENFRLTLKCFPTFSFVVVENLRFLIDTRKYLPSQPIYFGYELENIVTHEVSFIFWMLYIF